MQPYLHTYTSASNAYPVTKAHASQIANHLTLQYVYIVLMLYQYGSYC